MAMVGSEGALFVQEWLISATQCESWVFQKQRCNRSSHPEDIMTVRDVSQERGIWTSQKSQPYLNIRTIRIHGGVPRDKILGGKGSKYVGDVIASVAHSRLVPSYTVTWNTAGNR